MSPDLLQDLHSLAWILQGSGEPSGQSMGLRFRGLGFIGLGFRFRVGFTWHCKAWGSG